MNKKKIAIVGAGITGLTAAWSLQGKGHDVSVFERKEQPGGAIRSVRADGWLSEYGPNTLQLKTQKLLDFFHALNLGDQIREADSKSANRFVVRGGELRKVPAGFVDLIKTSLFSHPGKLKVLREPFVGKGRDPQESLASFVQRRLGREFLEYAIDPFVAGVYAGKPGNLSIRHAFPKLYNLEQQYGSLIGGAIRKGIKNRKDKFKTRLISFDNGLQVLPETIAGQLATIHYGTGVNRVQKGSNGLELIAGGIRYSNFDRIFLNIPLYRINEQLINGGGELPEVMKIASYPPLSVILTGYKREQIDHPLNGFGFLVPARENRKILGSLFNSSLFPNRAPDGHVMITTFVGGERQPELASKDTPELKRLVCRELEELLGASGEPKFFDHIYWPHSIPQYSTGYDQVLNAIKYLENQNPGIYLIGNFKGGIALPDCIESGLKVADNL